MTGITLLLFGGALCVAYANGANDNSKGVATLLGSGTTSYRGALAWGTIATFAGSLAAVLLSGGLVAAFSGRGIVPETLVGSPSFLAPVGCAAAIVVMGATQLGLPVSTTHALVGGLAGAGAAAAGFAALGWGGLASAFALPLLVSPACAALMVAILYPLLRSARLRLGVEHDSCVCVVRDAGLVPVTAAAMIPGGDDEGLMRLQASVVPAGVEALVASREVCIMRYKGRVLGFQAASLLDRLHYLSAGVVSFSRGVNDTPKIAALMIAGAKLGPSTAMLAIGAGMIAGALLNARRVARTISYDITEMNTGQGFTANLSTAALVLGASRLGMPVSTTHVSVGSLIGLGVATKAARGAIIGRILIAWFITLPAGFGLGWMLHRVLG